MANSVSDVQLLGPSERGRQLQKLKKHRLQGHEDKALEKLEKFKQAALGKPIVSSSGNGGGNDEDLSDWKEVRLKFTPGLSKDHMARKEDLNDYVVLDPPLEKGKDKFNRMQAKQT